MPAAERVPGRPTSQNLCRIWGFYCPSATSTLHALPFHRTINVVPKRRRHAENDFAVAIVVNAVIDPECAKNILGRAMDVHQVMYQQVARISHKETGTESKSKVAHDRLEEYRQDGAKSDTQHGWHGNPVFILWVQMMHAMHRVLKFLPEFGGRWNMENASVYLVLYP